MSKIVNAVKKQIVEDFTEAMFQFIQRNPPKGFNSAFLVLLLSAGRMQSATEALNDFVADPAPEGVYTFLDASTGHLTLADHARLDDLGPHCPVTVIPYEQGCFIHAAGTMETAEEDLRKFGMSEEFITIWKHAKDIGCWYLRLDGDAPELEGFAVFN